jgi:hypothetical protein
MQRYEVSVRGTPDPPNSEYWVLDIANDYEARVALWFLVRGYRLASRHTVADELEKALKDSDAAHRKLYEQPEVKAKRGRPRTGEYRPGRH